MYEKIFVNLSHRKYTFLIFQDEPHPLKDEVRVLQKKAEKKG